LAADAAKQGVPIAVLVGERYLKMLGPFRARQRENEERTRRFLAQFDRGRFLAQFDRDRDL